MTSIEALESYMITNESAALAGLAALGLIGYTAYLAKKSKDNAKATSPTQPKVKSGPSKDEVIHQIKKSYGIDITIYPEDKFKNQNEVIASIRKDVTTWVSKIKGSSLCNQILSAGCTAVKKKIDDPDIKLSNEADLLYDVMVNDFGYSKSQITPATILRYVKVSEGINGWDSSIQIISNDASQDMNIFLGFICEDVSKMLNIVYDNYIMGAGFGDGDEGHVYYSLK